jgi:hypothetical protein
LKSAFEQNALDLFSKYPTTVELTDGRPGWRERCEVSFVDGARLDLWRCGKPKSAVHPQEIK